MKKFFFNIIIIALFLQGCTEKTISEDKIQELPVFTVKESEAKTTKSYPASIRGIIDIEIRPQVSGALESVYIDEGTYVTKGQILFKIKDRSFKEQLNNAMASVNAANAALINTQLEIDKMIPLVQNHVVSDFQLKTAQAAHKIALSNLEQAKAIAENAKINLGHTEIIAPVSGYIGRLPKRQGSLLSSTDVEALTTISNVEKVYVYFSLGEMDFIQFKNQHSKTNLDEIIKNLEPVSLELPDKTLYIEKGKIDVIDGQFDKNTGSILVRATFPNSQRILRSGNTGKIQMNITHSDALLVPQEATIEVQDKVFVFFIDASNKVVKKPIEILGQTGNQYLVGNTLKNGDRIILKGFEKLQDGMQIFPQENANELVK